jgi:hypothetical protein
MLRTFGATQMTLAELEIRVATLERKFARLAGKVNSRASTNINAWIDQIHGTFQDDATHRRAARAGHKWRKSRRGNGASRSRIR